MEAKGREREPEGVTCRPCPSSAGMKAGMYISVNTEMNELCRCCCLVVSPAAAAATAPAVSLIHPAAVM